MFWHYRRTGYSIFLVANDKFGLYTKMAKRVQLRLANVYEGPVLNRGRRIGGSILRGFSFRVSLIGF